MDYSRFPALFSTMYHLCLDDQNKACNYCYTEANSKARNLAKRRRKFSHLKKEMIAERQGASEDRKFAVCQHRQKSTFEYTSVYWIECNILPFKELLISWNALRPKQGHYSIYVSVNINGWSSWLLYAQWGSHFQKGAIAEPSHHKENSPFRVHQDAVEILAGKASDGFQIKIIAENGARLCTLRSIHVCASNLDCVASTPTPLQSDASYSLNVPALSQMALQDARKHRLCSPTSTAAVIRFLKHKKNIDPIFLAEKCWDASFDLFGNWVFNIAEAYHQLNDPAYSCWVERLHGFQSILDLLKKGLPVIISVRGPLPRSALAYENGHLLVVIGFDRETNEVLCMDPAFNKDENTKVRYQLSDLSKAWERKKNIAYVFTYYTI